MSSALVQEPVAAHTVADEALVERARNGEAVAFELLMRRHNQRVYRVARSVLHDPAEIEDVIQQAYVSAFLHLDEFEGAARWSTWLSRIAFNEALARIRQRGRFISMDFTGDDGFTSAWIPEVIDPERAASDRELALLVEDAVDRLPSIYRTVMVMREIEGMSIAETAGILEVEEAVVKTRLHRARSLLRAATAGRIGEELAIAYSFGYERCDRIVAAVMQSLSWLRPTVRRAVGT